VEVIGQDMDTTRESTGGSSLAARANNGVQELFKPRQGWIDRRAVRDVIFDWNRVLCN
jgi:hypothetical protein